MRSILLVFSESLLFAVAPWERRGRGSTLLGAALDRCLVAFSQWPGLPFHRFPRHGSCGVNYQRPPASAIATNSVQRGEHMWLVGGWSPSLELRALGNIRFSVHLDPLGRVLPRGGALFRAGRSSKSTGPAQFGFARYSGAFGLHTPLSSARLPCQRTRRLGGRERIGTKDHCLFCNGNGCLLAARLPIQGTASSVPVCGSL